MSSGNRLDLSLAITGSGGAGTITAGEMLLSLAGQNGLFGMMRRSFGPQIRGGEAAALLRLTDRPVNCMDDHFDLLIALDWNNIDRFVEEIPLGPASVIIADPAVGQVPASLRDAAREIIEVPMQEMAADMRAGRANMVALGLLARWLDFCADRAGELIDRVFAPKGDAIAAGSRAAFDKGFGEGSIPPLPGVRMDLHARAGEGAGERWSLTGSEGCGLGALRGGIRFAAAYPITPASDVLEWLAPRLGEVGGSLLQAEDELAAINMVIGASFGGVPAMTATSGPGMSLMMESVGLAIAAEIPAVLVNVMRGGPSTGIPTKSEQADLDIALYGVHGDAPHVVLAALDHADCILTTEWGVRLAEALQTVVVVLSDQNLAQSRILTPPPAYELPEIQERRTADTGSAYQRYRLTADGVSPMAIPGMPETAYVAGGLEHSESGEPSSAAADHEQQLDKRLRKITEFDFGEPWADVRGEGTIAIISWGSTSAAAREAAGRLAASGTDVRMVALRLLLPARPESMRQVLRGVRRILIVEQSQTRQFYRYLRSWYEWEAEVRVLARPGPTLISPGEIVKEIEHWS